MSIGPRRRVLFVCTGNSARSQLGEALLSHLGGPDVDVASAGVEPQGVNPLTVQVLAGRGIDWSAATSDPISRYLHEPWDVVITVCDGARSVCPVFPGGGERLHWGLPDPAAVVGSEAERIAAFERTADELVARIGPFLERLRASR